MKSFVIGFKSDMMIVFLKLTVLIRLNWNISKYLQFKDVKKSILLNSYKVKIKVENRHRFYLNNCQFQ